MEFRLKITCNTAAFGDMPEQLLAALLRGIANTLEFVGTVENDRKIVTPVADVNGIKCGTWILDPKTQVLEEAERQETQ